MMLAVWVGRERIKILPTRNTIVAFVGLCFGLMMGAVCAAESLAPG
jgi:hypothetical protein